MKIRARDVVKENKLLFSIITFTPVTYWALVLTTTFRSVDDAIFNSGMFLFIGCVVYWLGYKLKKSELRIAKNKNRKWRK